MQTEYKGIAITYNESSNRFDFTLRGRDRFAHSLADAKKKIDEPSKEKTFKRCEVYVSESRWSGDPPWSVATATSIDTQGHVWLTRKGGSREKAWGDVYPVSVKNTVIVNEIKRLDAEKEDIEKIQESLLKKLERLH